MNKSQYLFFTVQSDIHKPHTKCMQEKTCSPKWPISCERTYTRYFSTLYCKVLNFRMNKKFAKLTDNGLTTILRIHSW